MSEIAGEVTEARGRRAMWGTCKTCSHTWKLFDLPMDVMKAARMTSRARCPSCGAGAKEIVMAKEAEIVTAEAKAEA